ncbi:MAG: hypothetical protein RLZZ50_901, partial [Verrucomicrobiota bacterium]
RQSYWFTRNSSGTAPGFVRLSVSGTTAALTWTGANGGLWDRETTVAWSGASPATFFNADDVTFDDSASSGNVTITQPVSPRSIIVNNTAARAYTFSGAPITGTASLVKSGPGTLTLNVPQYTLANSTLTAGSVTVTVSSTANLRPGMTVIGAGIPAGTTLVSAPDATTVVLSQAATATSATASLIFETRNTYSGGTILTEGSLTLACNSWQYYSSPNASPSNAYGLGTGPITLNGGILTLLGHTVDTRYLSGSLPNDLIVPAGKTATLRSTMRGTYLGDIAALRGSLTGSGTLNLVVNYAYGAIVGDWSAFAGTLNVSRPATGFIDPRFQLGHELGLPLATVNLDQVTLACTAVPPPEGMIIPLGSLSGGATAVIAGSQTAGRPVTWQVGGLDTSSTFAGAFTPVAGGGPIGLAKTGAGTWTLTGSGTVSAGITVEAGTLTYGDASTDTLSGTSEIVVNPGATLHLNQGSKISGSSCELFPAATLRGNGTLEAALNSSGNLSVNGGTLALVGNAYLDGDITFASPSDRLAVSGNLVIAGTITLPPAATLAAGRNLFITCSGMLTVGDLAVRGVPSGFDATLDGSTPGELAVVLAPRYTYADWQSAHFASPGGSNAAPLSDPDLDGISNLLEYALGGTPAANDAARLPVASRDGDYVVFTFSRRDTAARQTSQVFEYSADLSAWTALSLSSPPPAGVTFGPVASDMQTVTVRLSRALAPGGRLFGRLRVTLP